VARELAPARVRSSRNFIDAVILPARCRLIWGGFATQREQAPSPQVFAADVSGNRPEGWKICAGAL